MIIKINKLKPWGYPFQWSSLLGMPRPRVLQKRFITSGTQNSELVLRLPLWPYDNGGGGDDGYDDDNGYHDNGDDDDDNDDDDEDDDYGYLQAYK